MTLIPKIKSKRIQFPWMLIPKIKSKRIQFPWMLIQSTINNMQILKWFVIDNQIHFQDVYVCAYAVINSDLETLKYLHENGYPWKQLCCELTAEN
jgi:hypothetical protein